MRKINYFENYDMPEKVKNIATAIMKRFVICGQCDAMYIANVIGTTYGFGDGMGHFYDSNEINHNTRLDLDAANRIQTAYASHIDKFEINELIDIISSDGQLDEKKFESGLRQIISDYELKKTQSDDLLRTYLETVIKTAKETLSECKYGITDISDEVKNGLKLMSRKPYAKDYGIVYTAGAYDKSENKYGGGILIYTDNTVIINKISDYIRDYIDLESTAGEMHAVTTAIEMCRKQGLSEIDIHCNNEMPAKWSNGTWTVNDTIVNYQSEVNKHRELENMAIWFYPVDPKNAVLRSYAQCLASDAIAEKADKNGRILKISV